ncbi:S41 family peptidase [Chryseobacterium sp. 6424]|uniref:S41 family peptidase n=1 Tax=Chryseobacterium sp. 6424 TaxID=2039166 RepID=UPI0013CEBA6A|nr:S41 family peptidase [Chryseobacterium sp. 6424]
MKKYLLVVLPIFIITSCVSVKRYNEKIETPVAAEQLKDDVDFAYKNLQRLHPQLFWYIDRPELDHKFDSLKSTINQPLKPNDFFWKLAPVIAEIKEAHLRLVPLQKRLTQKEIRRLKNQRGLFSRFSYLVDGSRLIVTDNPERVANMNTGTEILKINDLPVTEMLQKYRQLTNSDGENTTFQKYILARRWPTYFTTEYGISDSVKLVTKYCDTLHHFYLKREAITTKTRKKEEAAERKILNTEKGKTKDYNPTTKSYNRELRFLSADSSIAYMRIKTFSGRHSMKFYKESFSEIKKRGAKYLILDIRENFGGSLAEINNLYSYLVSDRFEFIKDIEVTSRTSMFEARYLSEFPLVLKPLAIVGYPFYLVGTALSVKKEDDRFYLRNNGFFALKNPKDEHFSGKIYVLINGGSFSAASILPSKLKYEKKALLVGEETGGANDGTVAGRYAIKKLPSSKLPLPIGLMLIQPNIEFSHTKKGVVPHHEILPSSEDVLRKKDIQLEWVLNHIKHQ